VLEPRYLSFSAGLLDGEAADEETLASLLSTATNFSLCGLVGKGALAPRYLRIPLGLSAGFLDGDIGPGELLKLWRGAVDSE
jgi:hypothetical protein